MAFMNQSILSSFVLLGFPVSKELQPFLFLAFLIIYLVSFACNFLIMAIVCCDNKLHSPMYFFICIFSFLEICYTSVTMPRLLIDLNSDDKIIPIPLCVAQFYFLFVFGSTENFLLSSMAYDRYTAISNPLRYNSIMTPKVCIFLAAASWVCGFLAPLIPAIFLSITLFCGSNIINHFYCDFSPLLHHSCATGGLYIVETAFFSLACLVILGNLVFISMSYGLVMAIIANIPSLRGRRKTLSTCGSHLTVVCLFYGSIIYMYVRSDHSIPSHIDKVVSLFYCVITPTLNPLIYGLRNQEMKQAIKRKVTFTICK
ncbi:olfactory receptor 11G2-like [Lithobates pipiens]